MIPRLPVYSPLCEIATTSPNGVTRFCNGRRSRRILAGTGGAHRLLPMFSEINDSAAAAGRRPFGTAYLGHRGPDPMNLRQFSGDPKRLSRGGGPQSGMWSMERLEP